MEKELRLDVEREIKTFELKDVDPAEARRVLDAEVGNLEYVTTTVPGRLVIRVEPARIELIEKVLVGTAAGRRGAGAGRARAPLRPGRTDCLDRATRALSTSDMKDLIHPGQSDNQQPDRARTCRPTG